MSIVSIVVLAVIAIALVWAIMMYNNLVNLKHGVAKAWSNIDILLKQRHDELPKLVETCKQYKQFEQATLQKVTDARGRVQEARVQQDIVRIQTTIPITAPQTAWQQTASQRIR